MIHFTPMQLSRAVQSSAQHSKIKHGYMFRIKVWSFQNLWKYFVLKMCMFCLREISLLNLKTTNEQQNLKPHPFVSSQLSTSFSHFESSITWPSIFISGLILQSSVSSSTCWVGWLIQAYINVHFPFEIFHVITDNPFSRQFFQKIWSPVEVNPCFMN